MTIPGAVITGTAIGLLIWLALWLVGRRRTISFRVLFGLLICVGLACRLAFLFGTPTFYAPDEQSHYSYVRYLAEERAFPVQASRTGAASNDWEYYQPPLYYLALVPLYWAADALWGDPDVTVRLLRLVSIALWGATLWFSARTLDRLLRDPDAESPDSGARLPVDEGVRAFALGIVCLLPTYTFISSALNNDNLLIALGSALLFVSLGRPSWRRSLVLGAVLGLAMLTKLTAVVYVVWLGGLALFSVAREPGRWPRELLHLALTGALAALLWAPWGWRNLQVYGSLTAEGVANVPRAWKSTAEGVSATLRYMQDSFWAVAGIYNNVRGAYPVVGRWIGIAAAAGWVYGLSARRWETLLLAGRKVGVTAAMVLALAVNAVLVFRFGVLYGQGQGRFFFPLLLPIALLLGVGLRAVQLVPAEKARLHLAGIQIAYLVSFLAYSLAVFARL